MIQKTFATTLCALLFFPLLHVNAETRALTLEDVIYLTENNNLKIQQYKEKTAQKEYANKQTVGNFLPALSVNAGVTRMDDPLFLDLSSLRDGIIGMQTSTQVELANLNYMAQGLPALTAEQRLALSGQYQQQLDGLLPPFSMTLKEQQYNSASLTAVQPLFMGGKLIAAKKAAKADLNATRHESTHAANAEINSAVTQYINLMLLKQVVETRKLVLDGMNKHQRDAELLYKQGLIAKYNLLRAKVAVADAEKNLFDDENTLALASLALAKTLAIDGNTDLQPIDSLVYKQADINLNRSIAAAQNQQPLLGMIEQKQKMAHQKYVAARADFLPAVVGVGKYEMYPEYLSALEPRWAVGVQAQYTLLNGAKRVRKLQEAKHLEKQVELTQRDLKDHIELWVVKSHTEMKNAETRLLKLESNIELAQESLKLNKKRFASGLGTSLEVVDAQLVLEKNMIDQLVSLADYYRAMADLYYAQGRPSEILTVWRQ